MSSLTILHVKAQFVTLI